MRINSLQNYNITPKLNTYKYTSQQIKKEQSQALPNTQLPTTAQYLAFTGGYSLNLRETVAHLDKLAEKNSSLYPPNIREWVGMILEEGNKSKETLISVHKKYFAGLKECFSLNEIKKRFPEFNNVISSEEVKASAGSIIDKFRKGQLEYFDNNEDLTVQLIKLYWGEGFSTNDLKRYADGLALYHAMKKLNIPSVSRDYGHILKISDPQYNERLTREMTEKRLATLDRKAQLEQHEPVYIRRGPLSEEHKGRISEGLKKYYQENPERIYEMSERQKEFYRQSPEKSEELTRVLKKAWSVFGADRIKNALSKFLKGQNVKTFNPETSPENLTGEQSNAMKAFWELNDWARKSFSKNMKYAWKKVKEENETFFTLKSTPTQLTRFIEQKAGLKSGTLNNDTIFNPYTLTSSIDETANEICTKYTDIKGINNVMADTYQIAVVNIAGTLKDYKPQKKNKAFDELLALAAYTVKNNIAKDGKSYKVQYTEEAQQDFIALAAYAAQSKCEELVNVVNKALDDAFELASSVHPDFILK